MRLPSIGLSLPRVAPGEGPQQALEAFNQFATELKESYAANQQDASLTSELARTSRHLKQKVLENSLDFNPKTASFQSQDMALNISLAAASAGAIDSVLYLQHKALPSAVEVERPTLRATGQNPFQASGQNSPESRGLEAVLSTMGAMHSVLIGYAVHSAIKQEFASGLLERNRGELVEALASQNVGPAGYYQLGYRVGSLAGLVKEGP